MLSTSASVDNILPDLHNNLHILHSLIQYLLIIIIFHLWRSSG